MAGKFTSTRRIRPVKNSLNKVGKALLAFALIEELRHHHNDVVEPGERVNLTKHELKASSRRTKMSPHLDQQGSLHRRARNKTVAAILADPWGKRRTATSFRGERRRAAALPADAHVKVHGCGFSTRR